MMRAFLSLLFLLTACGQVNFNPLPPCFPFCGGGEGEGSGPPPPVVRSLEVVLLREVVEATPGASGTYVSLPVRVRLQGDPGPHSVYLRATVETPEGNLELGNRTLAMRDGGEADVEVSLWVAPSWLPGDYRGRLVATPLGPSNVGPVSRPFALRVH